MLSGTHWNSALSRFSGVLAGAVTAGFVSADDGMGRGGGGGRNREETPPLASWVVSEGHNKEATARRTNGLQDRRWAIGDEMRLNEMKGKIAESRASIVGTVPLLIQLKCYCSLRFVLWFLVTGMVAVVAATAIYNPSCHG